MAAKDKQKPQLVLEWGTEYTSYRLVAVPAKQASLFPEAWVEHTVEDRLGGRGWREVHDDDAAGLKAAFKALADDIMTNGLKTGPANKETEDEDS